MGIVRIKMNIETVHKKIHKVFDEQQHDPNIEVEMRLGKFNGKLFDTNVGKDTFDKVYRALVKYQGWEKIYTTQEEVFYRDRDNIRMSIDETSGEQKIVQKTSVHKEDFKRIKVSPMMFASRSVRKCPWRLMISVTWIGSVPSIVSRSFERIFPST